MLVSTLIAISVGRSRLTSVLIMREPDNIGVDLLEQRSGLVTIK